MAGKAEPTLEELREKVEQIEADKIKKFREIDDNLQKNLKRIEEDHNKKVARGSSLLVSTNYRCYRLILYLLQASARNTAREQNSECARRDRSETS